MMLEHTLGRFVKCFNEFQLLLHSSVQHKVHTPIKLDYFGQIRSAPPPLSVDDSQASELFKMHPFDRFFSFQAII